jgi:hypothetical protein
MKMAVPKATLTLMVFVAAALSGCRHGDMVGVAGDEDIVVAAGTLIESSAATGSATYEVARVLRGTVQSPKIIVRFFPLTTRNRTLPHSAILLLRHSDPLGRDLANVTAKGEQTVATTMFAVGRDATIGILPHTKANQWRVWSRLAGMVATAPEDRLTEQHAVRIAENTSVKAQWHPSSSFAGCSARRYSHGWVVMLYGHDGDGRPVIGDVFVVVVGDDGKEKQACRIL